VSPFRAIGSVLPLPETGEPMAGSLWGSWTAGRPVAAFQTARGALSALLAARGVRRLWLPAYVCDAVAQAAAFAGTEVCWYGVDASLDPDLGRLSEGLLARDAALVVAYFGRSPSKALRALAQARSDVLWIEDRAQALSPDGPSWAQAELYSPRKLIGVPDGGLLVGQSVPPAEPAPPVNDTAQRGRAGDPDGLAPGGWYPAFQAQEAALDARPLSMSALTRDLLARIDPAPLAARRRANYAALARALPQLALWPEIEPAFAPLVFPVRVKDRDGVVARMAAERIFCPHHWPDLPSPAAQFPAVHALNAQLLSMPCDHRYDAADMFRAAERLRALAEPT
jgi:hypothetical protein